MDKVEFNSIEFQNPHPLAVDVLTLPPWIPPRHDVVAQGWPMTYAMDFTPAQT
jgi:hypothetical protein